MKKRLLITLGLLGIAGIVYATNPVTVANDAAVGAFAWSSPMNATTSDNIYATVARAGGVNQETNYLKATNYGFSVPSNAVIRGIEVAVERKGVNSTTDGNDVQDTFIKIVKADGSIGMQNKATTTLIWPTADTVITYGSRIDLWGETWTPTDINDADFGAVISANISSPDTIVTASVDVISITVYYGFPTKVQVKTGKLKLIGGKTVIR